MLIGRDLEQLKKESARILTGKGKKGGIPPLWDGKAGERIADVLAKI
jgi:UDP-N-acetylglucosamine 2-epimerase (non-hydrolysing)